MQHREIQGTTEFDWDDDGVVWRFDPGSPGEYEAVWDRGVDRLFLIGLRPAEQPYRTDGSVAYYKLEPVEP